LPAAELAAVIDTIFEVGLGRRLACRGPLHEYLLVMLECSSKHSRT
jgi:hypothetical protein